jgi:hypothetical protein
MSTIKSVTAIIGSAVGAAATSALLFGAGTAQASVVVDPSPDALGVSVNVQSVGGPSASSGWCKYTAKPWIVPVGVIPPLPVYDVPFYLEKNQNFKLWFPGVQTNTKWDVDVVCENGANTYNLHPVY